MPPSTGAAPPGYDFLVIGHEGFGQVEAVGPNVAALKAGDYVMATVRRPGKSIYDVIGTDDMTTIIDVVFRQIAMAQVDATFEVGVPATVAQKEIHQA